MQRAIKKGLVYLAWLIGILIVGLVLLAGYFKWFVDKKGIYLDKQNHLVYNDRIAPENFKALKKLYEDAVVKPDLLIINSPGGAGMTGIQMGLWIREKGLSVQISQLCASACANYVFPAAKRKILDRKAMVIWHGGPHQPNMFDQIDNVVYGFERNLPYRAHYSQETNCKEEDLLSDCRKQLEQSLYIGKFAESLFYYELGIDHNLPYYGQVPFYTDAMDVKKYGGFYYSVDHLRAMGIKNIQFKRDYWKPENSRYSSRVYQVQPISTHNRTDADLGMIAFKEILRDYKATHHNRYTSTELLAWYTRESMKETRIGIGHATTSQ